MAYAPHARLRHFAPSIYLLVLLCVAGSCAEPEASSSDIRIHNVSEFDYIDLTVGSQHFDSLPAGAMSEYRDFGPAYRYNYVRVTVDGSLLTLQPIDYVGEDLLGEGEFTYQIDITDLVAGDFTIWTVED